MKRVFRHTQLYKFLELCNASDMERVVLDCGAGGSMPPLALFAEYGYEVHGIEIDEKKIEVANNFACQNKVKLNIIKGDIRKLPYEDESMSFVFSYNTIFHMTKAEMAQSMKEIRRVLKPGGLCFVNFLSIYDQFNETGEKVGEGEFLQEEGDESIVHTYYSLNEGDMHFKGMDIVWKELRILERYFEGEKIRQGYIDYIAKK